MLCTEKFQDFTRRRDAAKKDHGLSDLIFLRGFA